MAILTLQELSDNLPTGTIADDGAGNLTLNIGTAINETGLTIESARLIELMVVLMRASYFAQVTHNADPANSASLVASFSQPFIGTPVVGTSGIDAQFQAQINATIPLNFESATDVAG